LVVVVGRGGAGSCDDGPWIRVRNELASGTDVGEDARERSCVFYGNPIRQGRVELGVDGVEKGGEEEDEDEDRVHHRTHRGCGKDKS